MKTVLIIVSVAILVVLLIGLPWLAAYRTYSSATGYLGREQGHKLQFVYVDKTHFDAYKTAVWFDDSLTITGEDGEIYCNKKRIRFPSGKNVAFVRSESDILFVSLDDKYFEPDAGGGAEIGYILGKVPHFKDSYKGTIDLAKAREDHVIDKELNAFLAGESEIEAGQQGTSADGDKPRR